MRSTLKAGASGTSFARLGGPSGFGFGDERAFAGSWVAWMLFGTAILLALVGIATVHSASSELSVNYLPRQLLWAALGLLSFVIALVVRSPVAASLCPGALCFVGVAGCVCHLLRDGQRRRP